jgi:hypothetical protein
MDRNTRSGDSRDAVSRAEALAWLNGRIGEPVTVALSVDLGGASPIVLQAEGDLKPWRAVTPGDEDLGGAGGRYTLGERLTVDLNGLQDPDFAAVRGDADDGFTLAISERVWLRIVRGSDSA